MSAGKVFATAVIVITVAASCSFGSYKYASNHSYKSGYNEGYSQGQKIGYAKGYRAAPKQSISDAYKAKTFDQIVSQYNGLVSDYNTLRDNVIRYVGQVSLQAKQPIHCDSSAYGIDNQFISTNCY